MSSPPPRCLRSQRRNYLPSFYTNAFNSSPYAGRVTAATSRRAKSTCLGLPQKVAHARVSASGSPPATYTTAP